MNIPVVICTDQIPLGVNTPLHTRVTSLPSVFTVQASSKDICLRSVETCVKIRKLFVKQHTLNFYFSRSKFYGALLVIS